MGYSIVHFLLVRIASLGSFPVSEAVVAVVVDDSSLAFTASENCQSEDCDADAGHASTYLLQKGNVALSRAARILGTHPGHPGHEEGCTNLTWRQTYCTVPVKVGTPGQEFDIVIDSGSNSLLVPSCDCVENHSCREQDGCFNDEDSESFVQTDRQQVLTYGSGAIYTSVVSEIIEVAGIKAFMNQSVNLMNERKLDFGGSFEGILGLGPPTADGFGEKTFVEVAHMPRYTVCFNSGEDPGAFRMGVPEFKQPLKSVGVYHWGVDFRGISVGSSTAPVKFCSPAEMSSPQITPCGGIPDTGSTLMMGPSDHLEKLFADICDNWPRCTTALVKNPTTGMKASQLLKLLTHCYEWLDDKVGIDEMPSLFLNIAGAGNEPLTTKTHQLEIPPELYISQMDIAMLEYARIKLGDVTRDIPIEVTSETVCSPNFAEMEYPTSLNGPVWIFGTPLFFAYNVGFDVSSNSMSFESGECGSCKQSTDSTEPVTMVGRRGKRSVRRLSGTIRSPHVNVKLPL